MKPEPILVTGSNDHEKRIKNTHPKTSTAAKTTGLINKKTGNTGKMFPVA
ncbi:hypothetical protein IT084_01245 [Desulfallas sp. Bu1-1]|nr:hypothetical protein [Desulfallas sp. Bu1-1]MBF7081607.1 hypothetical protein [Desulfallas sp. Bu1-1]